MNENEKYIIQNRAKKKIKKKRKDDKYKNNILKQ